MSSDATALVLADDVVVSLRASAGLDDHWTG